MNIPGPGYGRIVSRLLRLFVPLLFDSSQDRWFAACARGTLGRHWNYR